MPPVKKTPRVRNKHFLREWREHRQLNQEQAAERMDIDRTTLSRIERGEVPYNQDFLEHAAFVYGCDTDDLISRNPADWDRPRLVFTQLRRQSIETQAMVLDVIERMLKAG